MTLFVVTTIVQTYEADQCPRTRLGLSAKPEPANHLWLSLLLAANTVKSASTELFRRFGITPIQYNLLRILYGAGEEGRNCGEIAERMIDRDPDITRLLNRLIKEEFGQPLATSEDRRESAPS